MVPKLQIANTVATTATRVEWDQFTHGCISPCLGPYGKSQLMERISSSGARLSQPPPPQPQTPLEMLLLKDMGGGAGGL